MNKRVSASQARKILCQLIEETVRSKKPIIISGKKVDAVLISEEEWRGIQETLYLMAIPGMTASIKSVMAEPLA